MGFLGRVIFIHRRGGKQPFSRNGFEFDVYVEGQHNLPVPADEAVAWARMKDGQTVPVQSTADPQTEGYQDRKGTGG